MMFLTVLIVVVFFIGYGCIAFENGLKINKTATALLMCVVCWSLYMVGCADYVNLLHAEDFSRFLVAFDLGDEVAAARQFVGQSVLLSHLGDTCEILFFLMGAMTIVEVVDTYGGFNFVKERLSTKSKRVLLWRIVLITFFFVGSARQPDDEHRDDHGASQIGFGASRPFDICVAHHIGG